MPDDCCTSGWRTLYAVHDDVDRSFTACTRHTSLRPALSGASQLCWSSRGRRPHAMDSGHGACPRPRHPLATDVSFYARQGLPRDATGHKSTLECDTAAFVEFLRRRSTARPDMRGPIRTAALIRYDDADLGDDPPRPARRGYGDAGDDGYDDAGGYAALDDAGGYAALDDATTDADGDGHDAVSYSLDPTCEWCNRRRCRTCGGEHMARDCPNRAKATTHAKPRDTRAPGASRASL